MVETAMKEPDFLVLSDRQVNLIRHALGWADKAVAYRNYYNTDMKGADYRDWQKLVEMGLAVRWSSPHIPGWLFAVGTKAVDLARRDRRADRVKAELKVELERIQMLLDRKPSPEGRT